MTVIANQYVSSLYLNMPNITHYKYLFPLFPCSCSKSLVSLLNINNEKYYSLSKYCEQGRV